MPRFVGAPIKDNVVWASENQLKNRIPIVLTPHLAAAIAEIATQDPHSVKNKEYSAVTFWPSGQEIVELYSKVNGKPAQVNPVEVPKLDICTDLLSSLFRSRASPEPTEMPRTPMERTLDQPRLATGIAGRTTRSSMSLAGRL